MTLARTRFIALICLVAALAVGAAFLPLHRIPEAVRHLGAWAPVTALTVGALLLAALVPRTAISVACGALFGPLAGGVIALGAAMVAAVATFAAGRALGRDAIAAHAGDRLARIDGWFARQGLLGVIVVRLLPIAPYGLVGYAYGTTSVRLRNYLTGTLIGATPSAFSYAAVGAAAVRPGAVRPLSFAPATLGLLITIGAAVYWRRHRPDGTNPDHHPS